MVRFTFDYLGLTDGSSTFLCLVLFYFSSEVEGRNIDTDLVTGELFPFLILRRNRFYTNDLLTGSRSPITSPYPPLSSLFSVPKLDLHTPILVRLKPKRVNLVVKFHL